MPDTGKYLCGICNKEYARNHFAKHRNAHSRGIIFCQQCSFTTKTQADMDYHNVRKHGVGQNAEKHECSLCKKNFHTHYVLKQHKERIHGISSTDPPNRISVKEVTDDYVDQITDDSDLREELKTVKHFLGDYRLVTKRQITHNFRFLEPTHENLNKILDEVCQGLNCAAKFNIQFGYVLQHHETQEYKYFYAGNNVALLSVPMHVANRDDLNFLKDKLDDEDYFEKMMAERPDTKWRFAMSTNVTIITTLQKDIPIGCQNLDLPDFLKNHSFIYSLASDRNGKPYDDDLCFIRIIAAHHTWKESIDKWRKRLRSYSLNIVGKWSWIQTCFGE